MKLHRHTSQENVEMRTKKWPQCVQDDVEHDNIHVIKNSFVNAAETAEDKKSKMPDQVCANGLQLHEIPQDLQNIFPLERRVISP